MKIKKIAALALAITKASAFAPYTAINLEVGGEFQKQHRGLIRGGLFSAFYESSNLVGFINPYILISGDDLLRTSKNGHYSRYSFEANIGGGARYKINNDYMVGVSAFFDIKSAAVLGTKKDRVENLIKSITVSGEFFVKDDLTFRANVYWTPFESKFALSGDISESISASYDSDTNKTSIGKRVVIQNNALTILNGLEFEAMANTSNIIKGTKFGVQGFQFGSKDKAYRGIKIKAEYAFNKMFSLKGHVEFNNKDNYKLRILANIKPFAAGQKLNNKAKIDNHFYDFVERDIDIQSTKGKDGAPSAEQKLKDDKGQEIADTEYEGFYLVADKGDKKVTGNASIQSQEIKDIITSLPINIKLVIAEVNDAGEPTVIKFESTDASDDQKADAYKIVKELVGKDFLTPRVLGGFSVVNEMSKFVNSDSLTDKQRNELSEKARILSSKELPYTKDNLNGMQTSIMDGPKLIVQAEEATSISGVESTGNMTVTNKEHKGGTSKDVVRIELHNQDGKSHVLKVTKEVIADDGNTTTVTQTLQTNQATKDAIDKAINKIGDSGQLTRNQIATVLKSLRQDDNDEVKYVANLLLNIETSANFKTVYESSDKLKLLLDEEKEISEKIAAFKSSRMGGIVASAKKATTEKETRDLINKFKMDTKESIISIESFVLEKIFVSESSPSEQLVATKSAYESFVGKLEDGDAKNNLTKSVELLKVAIEKYSMHVILISELDKLLKETNEPNLDEINKILDTDGNKADFADAFTKYTEASKALITEEGSDTLNAYINSLIQASKTKLEQVTNTKMRLIESVDSNLYNSPKIINLSVKSTIALLKYYQPENNEDKNLYKELFTQETDVETFKFITDEIKALEKNEQEQYIFGLIRYAFHSQFDRGTLLGEFKTTYNKYKLITNNIIKELIDENSKISQEQKIDINSNLDNYFIQENSGGKSYFLNEIAKIVFGNREHAFSDKIKDILVQGEKATLEMMQITTKIIQAIVKNHNGKKDVLQNNLATFGSEVAELLGKLLTSLDKDAETYSKEMEKTFSNQVKLLNNFVDIIKEIKEHGATPMKAYDSSPLDVLLEGDAAAYAKEAREKAEAKLEITNESALAADKAKEDANAEPDELTSNDIDDDDY